MLDEKKIVVVMPAYNAARTLRQTYGELPFDIVDEVLLVDYRIGEISCPTKYFAEASSISFKRSVRYGLGVLSTSLKFRMQKIGLGKFRLFDPERVKLLHEYYHELHN